MNQQLEKIQALCEMVGSSIQKSLQTESETLFNYECIELCVKRCIQDQFDLKNWTVKEIPYTDERESIVHFQNIKAKSRLAFKVTHQDYFEASPISLQNPNVLLPSVYQAVEEV